MRYLNIASIRECTEAEGPGKRFALWCQGCLKKCVNCCNQEMQPLVKKHIISVDDLCVLIEKSTGMFGIEGVSFIGGEPFLQAESLACLAGRCRAKGLTALSFSGYRYEELISGAINGAKSLLSQLDILIDGEYRDNEPETNRRWIGSRNQRVFYLTSAYPNRLEYEISEQSVEYNVYDTSIQINGWPFDEISR